MLILTLTLFSMLFLVEFNLGHGYVDPTAVIWKAAAGWVWVTENDYEDAPLHPVLS